MTKPFELSRDEIFRDSAQWYAGREGPRTCKQAIVDFIHARAGKSILDFGCATGNYSIALTQLGFKCVGVDINKNYIDIAKERGVESSIIRGTLPFNDKSFDTVIMLEVLEHVKDLDAVLLEVKRVARKNVILTVPDNTGYKLLREYKIIFDHMLDNDHVNFFTKDSLTNLLKKYFSVCIIKEDEPVYAQGLLPWYVRKPITLGIKLGIVKPVVFYRLYTECSI